jgi:6-phosphogluconolactonase
MHTTMMRTTRSWPTRGVALLAVFALAACGGSGSRTPPTTSNIFTVGGGVAGLRGSGLTLRDNGGIPLAVMGNGQFSFPTLVDTGTFYAVTIATQPTNPTQTCTLVNGSGTVADASVISIDVYCANPAGGFLYLAASAEPLGESTVSGTVSPYSINPTTGVLTAVGGAIATGINPNNIAIDPLDRFILIGNGCSVLCGPGTISAYTVDPANGSLTPVAGNPITAPTGGGTDIAIGASGQFVYVTALPSLAQQVGEGISLYSIDPPTGVLTLINEDEVFSGELPGPTVIAAGGLLAYTSFGTTLDPLFINTTTGALTEAQPNNSLNVSGSFDYMAIDPTGRFLYTLDETGTQILGYVINPTTAALTPIAGSPFALGITATDGPSMDPTGAFLYLPYATGINAYAINPGTGALTVAAAPAITIDDPGLLSFDPSGTFAYTLYGDQASELAGFTINTSTGALTAVSGNPLVTAVYSNAIAVSH